MNVQLAVLTCWSLIISSAIAEYYDSNNAAIHFEEFIIKYNKHYMDEHEKAARFEVFKNNLERINRLNEDSKHAVFAINPFTDLSAEEFIRTHTGLRAVEKISDQFHCHMLYDKDVLDADTPESLDWREFNVVTRVKQQGSCGSCWAMGAAAHLEGQRAIKYKKLMDLSVQQLVDCDRGAIGCDGGTAATAFKASIKMGGNMLEKDYPYEAKWRRCRANITKAVVKVTHCFSYNLTSQEKVKQLLYTHGPIPIGIIADNLHHHDKGIVEDKICSEGVVGHLVLLVGYGTENGVPYWIVKNSWGVEWGEAGYFRMQRSDNPKGGCGMLNDNMATAVIK